jgi:hypothetical protein
MVDKKIVICLFCLLLSQLMYAQFRTGISAGLNLSNTVQNGNGDKISNAFLPRLNAGLELGYFFYSKWGLQSGVFYAGKGYRIKTQDNVDSIVTRLSYFEVPLKLAYKFSSAKENWIIVNGGFYAGYGLNQEKFEDSGFNRFDFGYTIDGEFGIKNNFAARLGYSHGLVNTMTSDKMKNFLFNFSLMYFFKCAECRIWNRPADS